MLKSKDNLSKEITLGRHWGGRGSQNEGEKTPGAPATQGFPVGRHWVDTKSYYHFLRTIRLVVHLNRACLKPCFPS